MPEVQKVITNAVKWACPAANLPTVNYGNLPPVVEFTAKAAGITGNPGLHEKK